MSEENEKIINEELLQEELNSEYILLFDQTDKPFLTVYLFIFILGIILTILGI